MLSSSSSKCPSPLQENPPSGSSSEGEEVDSHGEEEDLTPLKPSSSTIPIPNSNSFQTPTSVTQSIALSNGGKCNDDGEDDSTSTDDDDESGSDSNDSTQNNPISPSSSPAPYIKPISSKPMMETHKPKKPDNSVVGKRSLETDGDDDESGSDSDDLTQNNPIKPISSNSVGKRSLETDGDEKDSRKEKKMKKVEEDHKEKKSGGGGDHSNSKKLWTEQDEIDILKGMIDFKKTKGDPAAQVGAFFYFIKYDLLRSNVSKQQLQSKIRTLKRKYTNTLKRAKQPGEDPQISKPHEANVYKLSKKVWLGEVTVPSIDEKSKQTSKNVKLRDGLASSKKVNVSDGHGLASCEATVTELPINSCENPYLKQSFVVGNNSSMLPVVPPVLGHFFSMGNTRLDLIESCNANELDNKWKNVMIAETQAYIDRLELVKEQTKMMLDKLKSSN